MKEFTTLEAARSAAKREQQSRPKDQWYWSVVIVWPQGYAVYNANGFDTHLGISLEPYLSNEVAVYAVLAEDSGHVEYTSGKLP